MILRLVYSFFFFSLVTGNQRLQEPKRAVRTRPCENNLCICQDQLEIKTDNTPIHPLRPITTHHQAASLRLPLRVEETHYGLPPKGLIGATYSTATRVEPKSYDVEFVSDNESPSYQVPRPVQYVDEDTLYADKTICFTPRMVHRMVKAALEYVSQIPTDTNNIIDNIDQELNRMSDQDSIEELYLKKSSHPLDSKTIFKMVNKPTSKTRTNLVLKYELPSAQEPQCRDALEKLIEIAYNAYLELEKHPQCKDYLYRFASQQIDDRPKGHLEHGPDIKSLIASILEEVDKHRGQPHPEYNQPEYNINTSDIDIPIPEIQIPQSQDRYNVPQIHEIHIPQVHDIKMPQIKVHEYTIPNSQEYIVKKSHESIPQTEELIIPKYNTPHSSEYNIQKLHSNIPQSNEYTVHKTTQYNIPQSDEYTVHKTTQYNIPQSDEYTVHKTTQYNIPQSNEYTVQNIPQYNIPQSDEYTVHKTTQYNIPQSNEYTVQNIPQYNIPQSDEYTVHKTTQYNIPQSNEYTVQNIPQYNIPQSNEYTIKKIPQFTISKLHEIPLNQQPHMQGIDVPESQETIEDTATRPEDTVDNLIKLLESNDTPDDDLDDRFMDLVAQNPDQFKPQTYKMLTTLLKANKHRKIPKLNDILLLILDSEKNPQPWGEQVTDLILSYLIPDQNGNLDSRIVDIILNMYRKPTHHKHVEYILSLLKPIKEGKLDSKIANIILNLITAHQNNMLLPEHIDILLKLLKPSHNGAVNTKEVEIIDNLSRWNELGLSPNQLEAILKLLKPDLNGITDHRVIDIVHFLLTKLKHLSPNHINFILKFLYPDNGFLDAKRIEIIHFLLTSGLPSKYVNILLTLLEKNPQGVLNSRFLDILMFLTSHRILTPELLETIITLLTDEVNGRLNDEQVKSFFFQLAPLKQTNPKLIVDMLTLLNKDGLYGNIAEWLENSSNNVGIPNRDSSPVVIKKETVIEHNHDNQYRTPDGGYQTEDDFMTIFKWLDNQGLLNPNQGASQNELINKLLKILEMGERELGAVELTYMLKHEKPLVYQPVYYVKYRLPILSFISNMKTLIMENPQLTADPMKLLQELIVVSNVTEVSPNLQGFPKEEILKLTFNEGDLVQAKILDEQNLNLNEQITYVHGLNSDISPEEILQLNRMNEAKYYPLALKFREAYPESKVTVHEVEKIVELPTIQYRQYKHIIPHHHQSHTMQFIGRTNEQIPQQHNNAQTQSSN